MYAVHVHLSDLAVHSGGSSVGLDWGHTDRPLCGIAWLSSPWQGIICDDNLQVTDLTFGGPMHVATPLFDPSTLSSMVSIPLMGTLPSALGLLTGLKVLQLDLNPLLSGELPSDLAYLSALQVLHAVGCNLSGTIPRILSELPELNSFALIQNRLSGTIPNEGFPRMTRKSQKWKANWTIIETSNWSPIVAIISHLAGIDLPPNGIREISSVIAALLYGLDPGQNQLFLMLNELSGTVPLSLVPSGSCEIEVLDMLNNKISGILPPSLEGCSSLLWLSTGVSGNSNISGTLPNLGQLAARAADT